MSRKACLHCLPFAFHVWNPKASLCRKQWEAAEAILPGGGLRGRLTAHWSPTSQGQSHQKRKGGFCPPPPAHHGLGSQLTNSSTKTEGISCERCRSSQAIFHLSSPLIWYLSLPPTPPLSLVPLLMCPSQQSNSFHCFSRGSLSLSVDADNSLRAVGQRAKVYLLRSKDPLSGAAFRLLSRIDANASGNRKELGPWDSWSHDCMYDPDDS